MERNPCQQPTAQEDGWPEYRQQASELFAKHREVSSFEVGRLRFRLTMEFHGHVHWLDGLLTLWQHPEKQRCAKGLRQG